MATRIHKEHDAKTRLKIKTSQIVNRLMAHINDECDMKPTQIRAAEILLGKTLPDMQSITGSDGGPLEFRITWGGDAG